VSEVAKAATRDLWFRGVQETVQDQKTLVGSGPGSTALVPFTSSEGTMSAGGGARIAVGSHMFVAPEFRLGWEPETRIAVTIGMRLR
jgi:hypothetical protein